MSLTIRFLNYLSGRSRAVVWVITVSFVLLLGVIDYVTGQRISITFFYLLPVSLASWLLGRTPGRVVALGSALIMQGGPFAEEDLSSPLIALWNLAVRLGVFLVMANLISDFRFLLKHQTELSRTDPLTGILNRRAFHDCGTRELEEMRRSHASLTLAFMDIDNFKAINDAAGHAAGDQLLIRVAECLKSQLWGADTVARLGGDEYAILLPDTDLPVARSVLLRVNEALVHEMERANWPVTFSIGVVTCSEPPPDMKSLLHLADQVMYSAKHRGKNCIQYESYPEILYREQAASQEGASEAGLPQPRVPE
jgi:diguanylate cyclase (GGDEF)-like protein